MGPTQSDYDKQLAHPEPMIIRLVGAVLGEQRDEWAAGRRYLGPDNLGTSRLTKITTTPRKATP